ncbi:MAG: response regulator [Bdellovibrionota bacterium]
METRKVLLVDDDPDLLRTSKELLERKGFHVVVYDRAFNSSNFIASERPDLVLLDVNMPFLSGDRLFSLFQKDQVLRKIPVVFFSSNDENSLRALVRETGALGYICKSEMGGDFPKKVAKFLEQVPTRAAESAME